MRWTVSYRSSLAPIFFNEYAKERFISCCVSRTNEIASERWTVTAYVSYFSRTVLQLGTRARIQHKHWINSSLQASCLGRFMNARLVCSPDGDTCTFTSTVRQQLNPSCQLRWINRVSASCWLFPSLFDLSLFVKYNFTSVASKIICLMLEYAIHNISFNSDSATFFTVIHRLLQRFMIFLSSSLSLYTLAYANICFDHSPTEDSTIQALKQCW